MRDSRNALAFTLIEPFDSGPALAQGRLSVVRQGKRRAFTLIELLVVVAIIMLLIGILLPSLSRAREQARRAVCASNVRNIAQAIHVYAGDADGQLPHPGNTDGQVWSRVGYQRSSATSTGGSNTRGLWLLVREGLATPEVFLCPSTRLKPAEPGAGFYDFENHNTVSYSYQNQFGSTSAGDMATKTSHSPSLVILADANPILRSPSVTWSASGGGDAPDGQDNAQKDDNSYNHDQRGQNVALLDSHVEWTTTPRCGVNEDNIWTRADGSDPGADLSGFSALRATRTDSFLVP